jgi:hypothetical protein
VVAATFPVVPPEAADLTVVAAAFPVVPLEVAGLVAAGVKSLVAPAEAADLAVVTVAYPASVAAAGRDRTLPLDSRVFADAGNLQRRHGYLTVRVWPGKTMSSRGTSY